MVEMTGKKAKKKASTWLAKVILEAM